MYIFFCCDLTNIFGYKKKKKSTLYRWFKEENEQLLPLQLNDRITMVSAGLLKVTKVCIYGL